MNPKIEKFKQEVIKLASSPGFVHNEWFVKWHLEVVDKISKELLDYYPDADRELVEVMVWLHDYGKIVDSEHEYEATLTEGKRKLEELGFEQAFIDKAVRYIEILDKKMELDLHKAPIEVQIVSSADGCSHLVGPFFHFWWRENANKSIEQLVADNNHKMDKDWNRKIVLPEARQAFKKRYKMIREQVGDLPDIYIPKKGKTGHI